MPKEYWGELLLPIIRYHSRWRELTKTDFLYFIDNRNKGNRGFSGLEERTPVDIKPWRTEICQPLSENTENILEKIFRLSDENGFEIVFLNSPVAGFSDESYMRYNTLYQLCDQRGIRYIDYNKVHYKGFNSDTDFYDIGHVNTIGAEKLTRDFAEWFMREEMDISLKIERVDNV